MLRLPNLEGLWDFPPRLYIHPIDPNSRPFDSDDDGFGHRRGVIFSGHCRSDFTVIIRVEKVNLQEKSNINRNMQVVKMNRVTGESL
jgi:hypothetical protein